MNNVIGNSTIRKVFLIAFLLPLMLSSSPVQAAQKTENVGEVSQPNPAIVGAQKINPDHRRSLVIRQPDDHL